MPKEVAKTTPTEESLTSILISRINDLQTKGEMSFPENYEPHNAVKLALLQLEGIETRDKQPVLQACTQKSIIQSLFSMAMLGLNPGKEQCYFIPFGKSLTLMKSYKGYMSLARRAYPAIAEINALTIRAGDIFEFKIVNGKKVVNKHEQKFENIDNEVVGAYCSIVGKDGKIIHTDIMTIKEIHAAWSKSAMKIVDKDGNVDQTSTHAKFSEVMSKKSVISRACKYLIGSSDDANMVSAYNDSEINTEKAAQSEIASDAENGEIIDVTHMEEVSGDGTGMPLPELTEEAKEEFENYSPTDDDHTGDASRYASFPSDGKLKF